MALKLPPPIVFLIAIILIHFTPKVGEFSAKPLAFICLSLALLLAILSLGHFVCVKTTLDPFKPEKTRHLVTSGVYRFSRNPMYLSLTLCLVAYVLWQGNILGSSWLVVFVAFITRFQIVPEERVLSEKFGEEFVQYKQRTRRWI